MRPLRRRPQADVYHGHDLTGLPGGGPCAGRQRRARRLRQPRARSSSRARTPSRPRWAKWILGRLERRLAARATALVTVNRSLGAAALAARFSASAGRGRPQLPAALEPPPESPGTCCDRRPACRPIRRSCSTTAPSRRDRGLLELAEAMLEPGLERVHLVFLGYGSLEATLQATRRGAAVRRADPRARSGRRRTSCPSGSPRRTSA